MCACAGGATDLRPGVQPWSNSEHRRFLAALEEHGGGNTGKEWDLIAEFIGPSRTADDVKEHAFKYFVKLRAASQEAEQADSDSSIDDGLWTQAQDDAFERALAKFGDGALLDPHTCCSAVDATGV